MQSVQDTCGAIATYSYNNRHLVTGISYTVPPGSTIPLSAAVGYTYDEVGNRTQMTDGQGSTTYHYHQVSRDGEPISCTVLAELINSGVVTVSSATYLYNPRNPNGNFQHGTYQHYEQRLVQSSQVIGADPMPGDQRPSIKSFVRIANRHSQ